MPARISSQRGVALLAFTVVLAIVAFTVVLAYSVSSAKSQVNTLESNQKAYLNDVRAKLVAAYEANALTIDADSTWTSIPSTDNGKTLLALAGITPRWGLEVAISPPVSREGVKYRTMAAWLPLDASTADDPVMQADGTFKPCPNNTVDCVGRRLYVVVPDGYAIQRRNAKKATAQLEQLAANAQAFFKAKTLLDPERNVSVNYFRPPFGGCSPTAEQLPCIDSPQPIWGVSPAIVQQNGAAQKMTELLGLANAPVLNPWGLPIEACNGNACGDASPSLVQWDPLTQGPPYTMLFQTRSPWGVTYRVYAVQQL